MSVIRFVTAGFLAVCLAAPALGFEFNTDGEREGWTGGQNLQSVVAEDGRLLISIGADANDPFINGPTGSWDGDRISGIQFRIRFSVDVFGLGGPAVYFFPAAGSHGSFDYEVLEAGVWNNIYIDFLSAKPGGDSPQTWGGEIGRIRIDFPNNVPEPYTVEIDWVRFVDEHISNNNFEFAGLDGWEHEGAGDIDSFAVTDAEFFSEFNSVEVTGLGSGEYHALVQDIHNGLELEKGQLVSLVGAAMVPEGSWDADSELWFRVRESDGTNENLSPPTEVTVFGEWFQFQSVLELEYEAADRASLSAQLYSKNPAGEVFYFDDIFVDVRQAPEPVIENSGWPVNAVKLAEGQTIAIDGAVTAEEYEGAQAMVVNSETLRGVPDPWFPEFNHNGGLNNPGMLSTTLDDFNATYYFMWDDEFFYAAVSAVDDNYSFVGPDPNGSDTLQFVFAETPAIQQTANMYIPTIAPEGPDGGPLAKNAFGGWIGTDIIPDSEYAGVVDADSADWAVEIKIPWSSMQGDFANDIFPPSEGDEAGFAVITIDYDDGALEWFSCNNPTMPWESQGIERIYFIGAETAVASWDLY